MSDPIVIDLRNATPAETEQAFLDIRQHLCAETLFTGSKPKPNEINTQRATDEIHRHNDLTKAFGAVKAASEGYVWRRPLVMKFDGTLTDHELKRRFTLIGLEAVGTCDGGVLVRERPRIGGRYERLEALRQAVRDLEQDIADREAEFTE